MKEIFNQTLLLVYSAISDRIKRFYTRWVSKVKEFAQGVAQGGKSEGEFIKERQVVTTE